MKTKLVLISILALASILRIWGLDKVPPELFGDELDVGYHAYSLLHTGRDYYGQLLPTYIHSFSEWRAPLLMYVTVPFIAIFGLNEYGVRLPEAFLGILSVLLLYLLVDKTLKDKRVALFSALLLAISPWHLQYSRAAFEISLLLTLLLSGTLSFLNGLKNWKWLIVSAVLFGLTFYTYSTANVFTPFIIVSLVLLHREELKVGFAKKSIFPLLIFVVIAMPIAYNIFFGFASERFQKFSLLSNEGMIRDIVAQREAGGNGFIEKIMHNRPVDVARNFVSNYTTSFSSKFLFIDGDITFRHSIYKTGEFYWIQLFLILAGIYAFIKKGASRFWILWLLLAPIPAALTIDGAIHATRLILMLPPLIVLAAVGLNYLVNIKNGAGRVFSRNIVVLVIFLVLSVETMMYLHRFWVHYPKESWRWWHTGYKEAILFMKSEELNYQTIAFNNTYEPSLIRFLFWWEYSPDKFIKEFTKDQAKQNVLPGFDGFKVGDKYYFGSVQTLGGVSNFVKPGMIYLVSQRDEVPGDWDWEKNPPPGIKVLKTVRNPYNEPIFYVVASI
ncbi:MAG: hypothetical protein A3D24_01765 [Candidatus Blackburnbacteria bacterium RIFCSPHIGHO2_02_FULL_39_13]|uniref:Glycosyltransferase RgtA/B/C/D-like domain-containing protein n=1 Tax=Candidatus Blackburnbacteria bacterium RIFCSPLOWO2_01_FULL_40_20 TaxID=1797519 RepID=A0A1G1VC51_9BACT|nr:MAG: hypothetical protein UT38_C0005G0011 [Microgenomates group bacterium GW2011_GWA2_39_19]OGY06846.1 MAG: hypothetical protein A2694_00815 [Candidatus Blackburnbacteria bacterium RIFCSPHIGHO2_01_FULL_40_17]OGY07947.1 MAG: hypothetical protein A3D24_01765 [Candidatus Blackburnbacteria bacterium RIFCSPHIGHO2_02_FULL_39_13]OGY13004.1 MAG: hypothetical protein A3A77_01670 [Candidatus Blackburnbacteria bacterium RIFCSPLOWO2_01_FULL_40_20]HBL51773.1 hypothetical protein [Candidatus Blackburnbact